MRRHPHPEAGRAELGTALREGWSLIGSAALFSCFVNILTLIGPLFMLQVYDRVLSSRSEETLAALFLLVTFLFVVMGVLDHARGRVMARAALRFRAAIQERVFSASLRHAAQEPGAALPADALRDLDAVQGLISAPVILALFDMPWVPIFLACVFMFHPALGALALGGGAVLILLTILNQRLTRRRLAEAAVAATAAERLADQFRDEAEAVQALGMCGAGRARWREAQARAQTEAVAVADRGGLFATVSRTVRLFLQSAMLALGALLVLRGALTPGAMVASSILMGRALAPVEQAVAGWAGVQRATEGWRRLATFLSAVPAEAPGTALPRPRGFVEASQLTVVPPGQSLAALRMVSFRLEPGQALGVIGPSGAGKSTLARALTGTWRPAAGTIRLDGAVPDQYGAEAIGRDIGYLPQRVTLFDGTIAENIARLAPAPDQSKIVEAARMAGAHRMILTLPEGYDTRVTPGGGTLSGGQIQRIGLARALFGDPAILVLDEPNSNLDNEGSLALNAAIRAVKARGGAVLIMAHRPAAIAECDLLMVLDGGARRAFGPRDEVLRTVVGNFTEIFRAPGAGGVA
ncbi:type I secretion system permease/ATPase [Ostreiculturibacter nitratireducens]|uniref:type I secretion system permease/ATPase n=1 Tax=Ostreiculturibacter nitratireducens TaxID=3075226 RepID=UPI0031B5BBF8